MNAGQIKVLAAGFLAVFQLNSVEAVDSFEFDETVFERAWTGSRQSSVMVEYIPAGESLATWKRMITFQCHPGATDTKQVSGPYYDARKGLVAIQPETSMNASRHAEDFNLILFLGAPGRTTHIEFVIARFVRDEIPGVYMAIYSHRFPASRNVNVSVAIDNKERWIKELATISISVIGSSCAGEEGDSAG